MFLLQEGLQNGGDPEQIEKNILLEQCKTEDEKFIKTGVEGEEIEKCLLFYKDDPAVMTLINEQMAILTG